MVGTLIPKEVMSYKEYGKREVGRQGKRWRES
jgi:hypothetical protein